MFDNYFKETNFDFPRCTFNQVGNTIYCDCYFIESAKCCPRCGSLNISKNGHKKKTVFHCIMYYRKIVVILHIQKYICNDCNTIFCEEDTFSNPNELFSKESIFIIMEKLRDASCTFKSIAREMLISTQNVIDIFDKYFDYSPPNTLPKVLSFDEKHVSKSMTDKSYIFVIADFLNRKIYDIVYSRHKETISKYFSKIPLKERKNVEYITMDMWETYKIVAKNYFPNAVIAVDSFHVIENINRALYKVRTSLMNKYSNKSEKLDDNTLNYYLLKKFDWFFGMEFDDITDNPINVPKLKTHLTKHQLRKYLLSIDEKLTEAYNLKCEYSEFNRCSNINNCKERLNEIIDLYRHSTIESFRKLARTLYEWKNEIINSFTYVYDNKNSKLRLSSAIIEQLNSTIKLIQENGHGYQNYNRFVNRIIYVINKDCAIKNSTKTK